MQIILPAKRSETPLADPVYRRASWSVRALASFRRLSSYWVRRANTKHMTADQHQADRSAGTTAAAGTRSSDAQRAAPRWRQLAGCSTHDCTYHGTCAGSDSSQDQGIGFNVRIIEGKARRLRTGRSASGVQRQCWRECAPLPDRSSVQSPLEKGSSNGRLGLIGARISRCRDSRAGLGAP